MKLCFSILPSIIVQCGDGSSIRMEEPSLCVFDNDFLCSPRSFGFGWRIMEDGCMAVRCAVVCAPRVRVVGRGRSLEGDGMEDVGCGLWRGRGLACRRTEGGASPVDW